MATEKQVSLVASQVEIERDQLDQQGAVQLASVMPLIVDLPLGTKVVMPPESGANAPIELGEIAWRRVRAASFGSAFPSGTSVRDQHSSAGFFSLLRRDWS